MKITNKMRSKLFRIAHAIRNKFENFGQALAQAWKLIRLQVKMMMGNVRFSYYKVSGEVREAVGTLSVAYESKGTGRELPADSFMHYDCEAKGFRSFKIANLI